METSGTTAGIQIRTELPGPRARAIIEKERKYLAQGTKCWETPAVPSRAWGVWFEDVDGNVMMDWTNGMVTILGHSDPGWVAANTAQMQRVTYFNSPDFPNPSQAEAAEKLCRITPGGWEKKVFFCSSGTEANEAALKVARIGTRRPMVMGFLGGFHGRTAGTLALTASKAVQREHHTAPLTGSFHVPYADCYRCWYRLSYPSCELHCMRVIERYLQTKAPPTDVAAFIYEPVQGEGGYVVPPPETWQVLHEIARKHGILTIADEVQTCFGKSGHMFACEAFGVEPDIITMAKGLGNGAAVGAAVFPARYDFARQGMHSNTFGGQIANMESVLYTMSRLEDGNLLAHVRQIGAYLVAGLKALQEEFACIGDVRALGLLVGVDFVKSRRTREGDGALRDRVVVECYRRGLLLLSCGQSVIRITPAFTLSKEEADIGLGVLRAALEAAGAPRQLD
ncbi:MAG TPA: aminotransferase class III-fold pyridoxal phosphate-dependent enzyme [Candidatus Nitrosotenuis sp.]|jgi:4-aminobutyrate aminotransferase|nr:aminotransferase class III-fold pyridoxal phosphate-dependent enzyme [Candidatus Nitrosotenuis sp.]